MIKKLNIYVVGDFKVGTNLKIEISGGSIGDVYVETHGSAIIGGTANTWADIEGLVAAGVDAIVVDTAHVEGAHPVVHPEGVAGLVAREVVDDVGGARVVVGRRWHRATGQRGEGRGGEEPK